VVDRLHDDSADAAIVCIVVSVLKKGAQRRIDDLRRGAAACAALRRAVVALGVAPRFQLRVTATASALSEKLAGTDAACLSSRRAGTGASRRSRDPARVKPLSSPLPPVARSLGRG
jgi:hypothetical protein